MKRAIGGGQSFSSTSNEGVEDPLKGGNDIWRLVVKGKDAAEDKAYGYQDSNKES